MDGHELLIRHFTKWAEAKRQPHDADLLEQALDLRSFQDERGDTHWPAGSIEHLMLHRWPAHGLDPTPDAEAVAETLSAYVHFLRATGRMASGSADPKSLAKEARRAAPKMAAACADIGRHSQTKVLETFGREIGISFDGADGIDDLNERMQRIVEAWNDLPQDERVSRMPLSDNAPGVGSRQLTDAVNALLATEDDEWVDDALTDLPDVDVPPADPAISGPQARESGFVRDVLRLVEWVGEGQPVTGTEVLRLAPAEAAYRELGLGGWTAEWQRLVEEALSRDWEPLPPETQSLMAESFWWRSAADCLALERLWLPAHLVNLLDVRATKATPGVDPQGWTDEQWVVATCGMLLALTQRFTDEVPLSALLTILGAGILSGEPVSVTFIEDSWRDSDHNHNARVADLNPQQADHFLALGEAKLARLFFLYADTGIWTVADGWLHLTELGLDFGRLFFSALDRGLLTID